jgi:hypothetical protein
VLVGVLVEVLMRALVSGGTFLISLMALVALASTPERVSNFLMWAVAWLSGQLDLTRGVKEIEWEVDYLNAFTRNRHGKKGAETPVALFEWISVRDATLGIYRKSLTLLGTGYKCYDRRVGDLSS